MKPLTNNYDDLEKIINENKPYIFDGIIDDLFYYYLDEKCKDVKDCNNIYLHTNPSENKELYLEVAKKIRDLAKTDNIIPLFKKMVRSRPNLYIAYYSYNDKNREWNYTFYPIIIHTNDNYYIYNNYETFKGKDNANVLLIEKINGVNIKEIVKRFKNIGLTEKEINVALTINGLFRYIDIYDDQINYEVKINNVKDNLIVNNKKSILSDYNILRKNGNRINTQYNLKPKINQINNNIDNYSFQTYQKCLMMLNGLSESEADKKLFMNLFNLEINSYDSNDKQINAMILINAIIEKLESLENKLPENISKTIVDLFLNDIDATQTTLKESIRTICKKKGMSIPQMIHNNKFNANKFLNSVNNCFSHFSYSFGKKKDRIILHGVNIMDEYYDLSIPISSGLDTPPATRLNTFNYDLSKVDISTSLPIIFEDRIPVLNEIKKPFRNANEVLAYINTLYVSENEKISIDENIHLSLLAEPFRTLNEKINMHNYMLMYDTEQKRFLSGYHTKLYDLRFDIKQLDIESIIYIYEKLEKCKSFYEWDGYDQREYIDKLIKYKFSNYKTDDNIISELISIDDKSVGDLEYLFKNDNPLKREKTIRIMMKTLLSTLYLITNSKFEDYEEYDIDYSDINTLDGIDYKFEKTKYKNQFHQLRTQYNNLQDEQKLIDRKIKEYEKQIINPKVPQKVKDNMKVSIELMRDRKINGLPDKLKNVFDEIKKIEKILNKLSDKTYVLNPHDVIRHIRNSISHDNLIIDDIDISNISKTNIIIKDFDNGKQTFYCETNFGKLLNYINNTKFFESTFIKKNSTTSK